MSKVRVLVGTKKGAFICESDGARRNWKIEGPLFAGWEIYHMKGSPVDPDRIFASQTSGWFGQIIQRSDDGGKTWNPPGSKPEELVNEMGWPQGESNKFVYAGVPGTHRWYDGTAHPWEFKEGLAHRTFAERPERGAGRCRRRRTVQVDGRGRFLDRTGRTPYAHDWRELATRSRRHVPPHDPDRPKERGQAFRRHFRSRRLSQRGRRKHVEADQQRFEIKLHAGRRS